QPRSRPAGDELDQWRVRHDQPLPGAWISSLLVAAPELAKLERLYLRCHRPFTCTRTTLSSARMTASVLALQPGWLDLGVDLRCRQARMSEELLDRPQVRPALEQMGRERVPHRMRRDPAGDRRVADPALQA